MHRIIWWSFSLKFSTMIRILTSFRSECNEISIKANVKDPYSSFFFGPYSKDLGYACTFLYYFSIHNWVVSIVIWSHSLVLLLTVPKKAQVFRNSDTVISSDPYNGINFSLSIVFPHENCLQNTCVAEPTLLDLLNNFLGLIFFNWLPFLHEVLQPCKLSC